MTTRPLWKKPAYGLMRSMPKTIEAQLSRANCMHSDAASQGGGWWQGCGAAYLSSMPRAVPGRGKFFSGIELSYA